MIEAPCRSNLLAIAAAYAKANRLSLDQVSKRFYGATSFLRDFRAGTRSISLRQYDRLLDAFREDWPEKAKWPATQVVVVARPSTTKVKNSKAESIGKKSNRVSIAHERAAAEVP